MAKAQPIFPFTPGDDPEHYSSDKSDIVRYIVYVEAIMIRMEMASLTWSDLRAGAKSCVNGDYKAATILIVPYVTGTTEERTLRGNYCGLKEGGKTSIWPSSMKNLPSAKQPRLLRQKK